MAVVCGLLTLFLLAVFGFVLLSYAFAWYESANQDPTLLEGRFSPRRLLLAARLICGETLILLLTTVIHPFGWFERRNRPAASPTSGTPVILLHGLFQSRACWFWLQRRLRREGFHNSHAVALPPWKDVEALTERVAKRIDAVRHASGVERVVVVGHSMGGIIARNYLQLRGGERKVERCILLGTPNHGSKLAPFALSPLGRLVLPGSEFLARLNQAPIPKEVALSALYSRHENIILPFANARLDVARNEEFSGMGHTSLMFHPRIVNRIMELVKESS